MQGEAETEAEIYEAEFPRVLTPANEQNVFSANITIKEVLVLLLTKVQVIKTMKLNKSEVKIIYFGTPEFSSFILEKLIETSLKSTPSFEIKTVVTTPDQAVGRKQIITSSEVSNVALKYKIPVLKPEKLDEEFLKNNLPDLQSDLFIVASYGKIIPQIFLDIPKMGALNVHGSILPKYRGASPIQAAILNGESLTGVTIMLMDEKMDHGPIISTKHISLSEKETYLSLSKKMSLSGAELLIQTLPLFLAGKIEAREQNQTQATYCKLIKREDGFFDLSSPPSHEVLDRMIRAYFPWPNIYTTWKGKIVKFYPEDRMQMEGKNIVSKEEFMRGYPNFPISKLV